MYFRIQVFIPQQKTSKFYNTDPPECQGFHSSRRIGSKAILLHLKLVHPVAN